MSSQLKKVEHIVVFDMSGEMVAGAKEDPFWYLYQKQYYLGNTKLCEKNYNSKSRRFRMDVSQLDTLKKIADRLMNEPFCWTDDEKSPEWVEVSNKSGSSISYMGQHKEKFLQKVIGVDTKGR